MTDWSEGTEVTIDIEPSMLNLAYTLDCGQAFRWRCRPDGWWTGVIRGHAVRLRQEHTQVIGQIFPSLPEADRFLVSYFRLDVDLKKLYQQFAEMDPWIQSAVSTFSGLRVLDQEPQETLLSYVCSTANSVPRISRSVDEMSRRYGEFIGHIAGEDYFAFPIAARLANAQVDVLAKECGLG
ncbi:MAG: DNA glycosylase, partial [Chloroflexota bacterium]